MPHARPPPSAETFVITTTGALRAIVADEVERAVRRTFASLVKDAGHETEWITPREASRLYGRHRSTLHRWSQAGLLPTRKISASTYYSARAVERLAG